MARRKKLCSKNCSEVKMPVRFFGIDTRAQDGYRSECLMCQQKSIMDSAARKLVLISGEVDEWKRNYTA